MAKTIAERGLISTTIETNSVFSFDKDTRTVEANAYYIYCLQNSLILPNQEYSRTTLILKTYNHKGASGTDSDTTMRNWLKSVIPSTENNLEVLWEAYFIKYATAADAEGVTYAGLSVEAAYRKYLYANIGLNGYFYDRLKLADQVGIIQRKPAASTATLADVVAFYRDYGRSATDSVNTVETTLLSFNKPFVDSLTVAEAYAILQTKALNDEVSIVDSADKVMSYARAISEIFNVTEGMKLVFSKTFGADIVTVADAIAKTERKVVVDSVSFEDNLAIVIGYARSSAEGVVVNEAIALVMSVAIPDAVTLNDNLLYGFNGYAAEQYGAWNYGA
jgi:hypothetical protein